jgi:hypothetical protein
MGTGSLSRRVKRTGRGVYHSSHLASKLKKEYSYTSAPSLGLRGLFLGELHLYVNDVRSFMLQEDINMDVYKFYVNHVYDVQRQTSKNT